MTANQRYEENKNERQEILEEKFPCKNLERYLEKKIVIFEERDYGKVIKEEVYLKHVHEEFFYIGEEPNNPFAHRWMVSWHDVNSINDEQGNKIYEKRIK